jgi:hypothetical protein
LAVKVHGTDSQIFNGVDYKKENNEQNFKNVGNLYNVTTKIRKNSGFSDKSKS